MSDLNMDFEPRWVKETKIYGEKIKGMEPEEADKYLWNEYYFNHKLSKRAYEWLVYFLYD